MEYFLLTFIIKNVIMKILSENQDNIVATYETKIFQGESEFVEQKMNEWFQNVDIKIIAQTQSSIGTTIIRDTIVTVTFERLTRKE